MENLSKQKPQSIWLCAMELNWCRRRRRRSCHFIIFTPLMVILLLLNGCYGDQIPRNVTNKDTGISQVQFKNQRQALKLHLTSPNEPLLHDETIKSDNGLASEAKGAAATTTTSTPIVTAHILMNKSDRRTTFSAVETTTPYNRFDLKRDQHRNVHQSRNINGNVLTLDIKRVTSHRHTFKNTTNPSDYRGTFNRMPHENVPNSKPKIISKLSDISPYDRTTTYLSYNLNRDNVQRFMPTSYQQPIDATQIKQTNTNYIYKSYYQPIQRNNCNKCHIIPGAPIRHKTYFPTSVKYHYGMYILEDRHIDAENYYTLSFNRVKDQTKSQVKIASFSFQPFFLNCRSV